MKQLIKYSLLGISLMLSCTAIALESDSQHPINIESDAAVLNDKTGFTEYTGRAVLTQGTLKIEGDSITFHFDANKNITKAVAVGALAKYQQVQAAGEKPTRAQGVTMEYYPNKQEIILINKAHVWKQGDEFSGPRIKYDIANNIVHAGTSAASGNTGKPAKTSGRVRVTLQPTSSSSSTSTAPKAPATPAAPIINAVGRTGFVTTRLNVRSGPRADEIKIGTLPPRGQFTVLSQTKSGWLQVQTNIAGDDVIGWISRKFVKLNP